MSNRFLIIARVADDGFDEIDEYYLDFEVTVKPAATTDGSGISDWYCTIEVPENLIGIEGGNNDNDLYKYLQGRVLAELLAAFPTVPFQSFVDETDVLLQGVAGKGAKGDDNGPVWQNQWRRGEPYVKDDVVVWNNRAWICTQAMSPFGTYVEFDPATDTALWDQQTWDTVYSNPPVLARIEPGLHAALGKYVPAQGDPDGAQDDPPTPYLNPNRCWDPYGGTSLNLRGAWKASTSYQPGDVVWRGRKRRHRNGQDEEAEQTLQFICLRANRDDDPIQYDDGDGDKTDDPWEVFFDAREVTATQKWGTDPDDGTPLENADQFWYRINDVVIWEDATYLCIKDHQYFVEQKYNNATENGQEPDEQDDPAVAERWRLLSSAVPKQKGKWKDGERYRPGNLVWVDKADSSNVDDQKLQFICVKSHKARRNQNKPSADDFLDENTPKVEGFPWLVFLDLSNAIPDSAGGGTSSDRTVVELVDKKPFLRPAKVPKQNDNVLVLNAAAKKVGYDPLSTDHLLVELVFYPMDNGQDFPADFYAAKIEWWLYAYAQKKADLNNAAPAATFRITPTTSSGGTYDAGTVTVQVPISTEPGSATYGFGYDSGTARETTVLALAIKRVTSGDVLPKMTGRLESATVTVVPIEVS